VTREDVNSAIDFHWINSDFSLLTSIDGSSGDVAGHLFLLSVSAGILYTIN
jgi:hypothetical protein